MDIFSSIFRHLIFSVSNISNFFCCFKMHKNAFLRLHSYKVQIAARKKKAFFWSTKLYWYAHKAIDYTVRQRSLTGNDWIIESQNHWLSQAGRDHQWLSKYCSWPGTGQPQESYWLLILSLHLKMLCKLFIWKVLLKFDSKNVIVSFIYLFIY